MATVRDTGAMIAGMDPVLDLREYVFTTDPPDLDAAIATIREDEGLSAIVPFAGSGVPMRRITLRVASDLEGVGLTAAVATALTDAGIACNMVAGHHHDHAFVPSRDADRALAVLHARAAAGGGGTP
ncbi:ACT domain-containing protein [Jannaschia sp. LMIT008]|uniref:ACT domain-containing protein n=1 Tax=Jannaschia maritima TaxID=3032585 RepID=UPI00281113A2|nr:ACT domain-containing protein [Jannaschia sp. LMIT008]